MERGARFQTPRRRDKNNDVDFCSGTKSPRKRGSVHTRGRVPRRRLSSHPAEASVILGVVKKNLSRSPLSEILREAERIHRAAASAWLADESRSGAAPRYATLSVCSTYMQPVGLLPRIFSPFHLPFSPQQQFRQILVLTTVDLCQRSSKRGALSNFALRFG